MTSLKRGFVPRELFKEHLRHFPIPTFDLLVQLPAHDNGIVIARRRIAPYAGKWALPGLRMWKGESIDNTLERIGQVELGIEVDTKNKQFVGQYDGRFKTEQDRQDISTAYLVQSERGDEITPNLAHFSGIRIVHNMSGVPQNTGAMYRHYLQQVLPQNN